MQLPSAFSSINPQKFPPKEPPLKNFLTFSQKNPPNFQETELSYIYFKKSFSYILGKVYSEPWHI